MIFFGKKKKLRRNIWNSRMGHDPCASLCLAMLYEVDNITLKADIDRFRDGWLEFYNIEQRTFAIMTRTGETPVDNEALRDSMLYLREEIFVFDPTYRIFYFEVPEFFNSPYDVLREKFMNLEEKYEYPTTRYMRLIKSIGGR